MLDVSVTTIRPGNCVFVDRSIFEVATYEHVKPGKGGAFVRIKLRSLEGKGVLEKTLDGDAKITQVEVLEHQAQYLYKSADKYVFMNLETYDQVEMSEESMKDLSGYLKGDIEVKIVEAEGRVIGVHLPNTVELKIIETPPGVKGDTVSRGTKIAKLETGISVNVPLFISTGEVIRLDTRTGEYLERAS